MAINTANKYLKNGAISPLWQEIELRNYQDERCNNTCNMNEDGFINNLNQAIPVVVDVITELTPALRDLRKEKQQQPVLMASTISSLEDKFEFLKAHSNNEEDLRLAKFVLMVSRDF